MKRPIIVTAMGVLLTLSSVLQVALGILVFVKRDDVDFLEEASVSADHAAVVGVVLIALGLVSLVLAVGLFAGNRIARDLVGLVQVGTIIAGLYGAFTLDEAHRPGAVGSIGGAMVVLYFLFATEKAKAYFARA
jgi:hypothetical protein